MKMAAFRSRILLGLVALFSLSCASAFAQNPPPQPSQPPSTVGTAPAQAQETPTAAPADAHRALNAAATPGDVRLELHPGDEADVTVYGVADLSQHVRVSTSGDISLPLIGKLHVAGMTADEAQAAIEKKLSDGGFVNNPHVTVYAKEFNSQRVAITGEVVRPGLYPTMSAPRLYDVFLAAGGLTPKAGHKVIITHARNPQKPDIVNLSNDPAESAAANVALEPGDSIVVGKAGVVYVIGEVNRPGAFVIEDNQTIGVLQVMAMAEGPTREASLNHARIIRRLPSGGVESKDISVGKIMNAKGNDVALNAEDILFVPSSRAKAAANRSAGSILSMLTSLAVYHF